MLALEDEDDSGDDSGDDSDPAHIGIQQTPGAENELISAELEKEIHILQHCSHPNIVAYKGTWLNDLISLSHDYYI